MSRTIRRRRCAVRSTLLDLLNGLERSGSFIYSLTCRERPRNQPHGYREASLLESDLRSLLRADGVYDHIRVQCEYGPQSGWLRVTIRRTRPND